MLLPSLVICFIVGIVGADMLYEELSGGATFLFMGAICAFLVSVFSRKRERIFCFSQVLAFFLLGGALLVNERDGLRLMWSGEEQAYCATRITEVREKEKTFQVDARIEGYRVRLALHKDSLSKPPQQGDKLLLYARLQPSSNVKNLGHFDYANYLMRQGVSATAYCPRGSWEVVSQEGERTLGYYLSEFREGLSQRLERHLEGASLEVVSAMTLGNKHVVSEEVRRLYSETGASHVLALSGLHLSIIFALFNLLLLRPLRSYRLLSKGVQIAFLVVVWCFVYMVGAPLSLLRAALMLTLVQVGVLFQRDSLSLRNLSFAALLLLMWSPQSLFDVGFQLSFMAVLSIVVIYPRLPHRRSVVFAESLWGAVKLWAQTFVQDLLQVSIAAQIGTLPLVLFYFHLLPTYALPISLWVIPMATLVLALTLLFALLPFAECALGEALSLVMRCMNAGLGGFSSLPLASINLSVSLPTVVLLYALLGLTLWGMANFQNRPMMMVGMGLILVSIGVVEIWGAW